MAVQLGRGLQYVWAEACRSEDSALIAEIEKQLLSVKVRFMTFTSPDDARTLVGYGDLRRVWWGV